LFELFKTRKPSNAVHFNGLHLERKFAPIPNGWGWKSEADRGGEILDTLPANDQRQSHQRPVSKNTERLRIPIIRKYPTPAKGR
jgi:hypothetical protein